MKVSEAPLTLALRTLQTAYSKLSDEEFVKAVSVIEAAVETFNALSGSRRDAWLESKIKAL